MVPTYKRNDSLRKALQSVKKQSYTDFECIVLNDYPPLQEAVDRVISEADDPRIRVIHHEQNMGESHARNTVIRHAKGDIIALLDDDDKWEPDYLEMHVRRHEEMPEAGLVYSGGIEYWADDSLGTKYLPALPPPPQSELKWSILRGDFCLLCCAIISVKREVFDTCGLFDINLVSMADWDMWLRVSEKYAFAHIEKPLAWFTQHLGDRESTNIHKRMKGIELIVEKWSHYPEFVTGFKRQLKARAYFNEIRLKVIQGQRKQGFALLSKCIKECGTDLAPNAKLIAMAAGILLLGDQYMEVQKRKYTPA